VPSRVDTLALPGEYDRTCASFSPLESTIQTANRSVQPFLHSSRQKVAILTMGCSPKTLPLAMGNLDWIPSNTWFSGPTLVLNLNGISIVSAVFAYTTAECHYTLQWDAPSPQNCSFHEGSGPHLIHGCLGPPESSTQMVSRSVQLFLQSSLV